jgi:hypothetical protein
MDTLSILLPAILLTAVLLWRLLASRTTARNPLTPTVSPEITITPAPLLTETEASVYNLVRLAVQDRYLVLAHVPLWSFVDIHAEGKLRSRVFSHIALKQVDFALVHPGSRQVEQVILVGEASPQPHEAERRAVIRSVLDTVGIPLRQLAARKAYSVTDLSILLGLEPEESV